MQALKWEDEEDSLLPDLKEFDNFVLYANPKGLLIGPDVASYLQISIIRFIVLKKRRRKRTNCFVKKACVHSIC